ncbi:MAG: hypothetical protein U9N00_05805 [Candidatus Bipolaricaulota bacterium]|nr:hypothetical protein [Candidatus Bipolaricaulota bacterium]
MRYPRRTFALIITLGIFIGGVSTLTLAASHAEVDQALSVLCPTSAAEIMAAFEVGFTQGRIEPGEALHLIGRLSTAQGEQAEKEAILLTIAHALQDDLPVELLVDNVEEGLTRNIPLTVILNGSGGQPRILGLVQRASLLEAVRDLLYSKRIFSAPEGTKAVSTCLPNARFDCLVSEIAGPLADYLEGGGSPLEGYLMFQQVSLRLQTLAGLREPPLLVEEVDLVLERLTPTDLTNIALPIL